MLIKITDQNFVELIAQTDKKPLLVDFWTSRQESCRYNAPVADELSKEFDGRCDVGKVNVDECPYMIGMFQVKMVPSMALFQQGRLIALLAGVVTKDQVLQVMKEKGLL